MHSWKQVCETAQWVKQSQWASNMWDWPTNNQLRNQLHKLCYQVQAKFPQYPSFIPLKNRTDTNCWSTFQEWTWLKWVLLQCTLLWKQTSVFIAINTQKPVYNNFFAYNNFLTSYYPLHKTDNIEKYGCALDLKSRRTLYIFFYETITQCSS